MDRKEILEKLARQEITQEEAERLLAEAGAPIPETPPLPPRTNGKSGKGCLIALLIGLIAVPLFFLFLGGFTYLFLAGSAPDKAMNEEREAMEMEKAIAQKLMNKNTMEKMRLAAEEARRKQEQVEKTIGGAAISMPRQDWEKIMDQNKELDERLAHIRKMEREKKITAAEAEKLIRAVKDSLEKEKGEE